MAGRATPETTMNHRKLIDDAWTYNVNIRAEDGPQPSRGWRALLDNLLIPVGFILALLLLSILMSHSAFASNRKRKDNRISEGRERCPHFRRQRVSDQHGDWRNAEDHQQWRGRIHLPSRS